MPMEAVLDPQGKAVTRGLHNLGLKEVSNVRIGKHVTMHVEAKSKEVAEEKVEEACQRLLANQVMENYRFTVEEAAVQAR